MQISSAELFIFIEGKTDRFFYNKICDAALCSRGTRYQIRLAQELPGQTGGKGEILKFFSYLNRQNALLQDFKGRRIAAFFILDKDIEDLSRTIKKSNHLVYTEHYELENYLYIHGNLIEATAAASTMNHAEIRQKLPNDKHRWRKHVAENWKDWVKLCVFTVIRKINYDSSFSVPSRINNGPYTTVVQQEYDRRLLELEVRSGLTRNGFLRAFRRISEQIDQLYDQGHFDRVFKGKWYSSFLAEDARRIAAGGPLDLASLPDKLALALQLTLNFEDSWAEHFRTPLQQIADSLRVP